MKRVTSTVLINVEVEHPDGWTMYDLHDALRFHLNLSDLNAIEVDISAVDIRNSRVIDREEHPARPDEDDIDFARDTLGPMATSDEVENLANLRLDRGEHPQ